MSKSSQPTLDSKLFPDSSEAESPSNELAVEGIVYPTAEGQTENLLQEGLGAFGMHPAINGKDEMNLAEFPIARLGRNDTRLTIEYKGQITDKLGNVVEQRWLVSGNATFGLPTEFADRVLVALMYITNKENLKEEYPDRRVPFTTYRILKLLGLSLNQRNYGAVEKALQQLVGVTIYSEGAFWDHEHQRRVTTKKGFHILEEFWLKSFDDVGDIPSTADDYGLDNVDWKRADADDVPRASAEQAESKKSITGYIVWGERIWDSFQAGYIKNLNVEFYYALQNTLARRLYRFLDKRMHYQNSYQIDIFDLAARMGMKPYPYASHVARKLKPAFEELLTQGYLVSAEVIKVGNFTRVRFERAKGKYGDEVNARAVSQSGGGNLAGTVSNEIEDSRHVATSPENDMEGLRDTQNASRVQTHTQAANGPSEADFEPLDVLRGLWASLLAEYQRTLPAATYAMLATSQLIELEQHVALIEVEARYQEWIERQMVRQIKTFLNRSLDAAQRVTEVKIVTR